MKEESVLINEVWEFRTMRKMTLDEIQDGGIVDINMCVAQTDKHLMDKLHYRPWIA